MNFFRITALGLTILFIFTQSIFAESHDTKKNIVEQSKDLNKEIIKKQAVTQENIGSEIDEDEIPLNDPFAGDVGTSTSTTNTGFLSDNAEEERNQKSLYNYKLVGIISGYYESYISLVNPSGEIVSLVLHEELNETLKLVDMRLNEAIFKKSDGTYMSINFNNQIIEKDEY